MYRDIDIDIDIDYYRIFLLLKTVAIGDSKAYRTRSQLFLQSLKMDRITHSPVYSFPI